MRHFTIVVAGDWLPKRGHPWFETRDEAERYARTLGNCSTCGPSWSGHECYQAVRFDVPFEER